MTEQFSHITLSGAVTMVNVGGKIPSVRIAKAKSSILFNAETFALLEQSALPKGDVLVTAKIAGIMAAKQTATLIPMCHPLPLSFIDINFEKDPVSYRLDIIAEVHTHAITGVEVEALVAVQIAAITVYDMCKAVQKNIIISDAHVFYKSGGKSGEYRYQHGKD